MNDQSFNISYARFRFTMKAMQDCMLPPYLGSTLRGAMGVALRNMVCLLPGEDCRKCMHRWQCAYAYIMATGREETSNERKTRIQALPVPYVIEPPEPSNRDFAKGDLLHFHLLLIGKSISLLPVFITAFEKAATTGLGKGRSPFLLRKVEQEHEDRFKMIWSGGNQLANAPKPIVLKNEDLTEDYMKEEMLKVISIRFLTPMRLVDQGKLDSDPDFLVFMRAVFRRLDSLGKIHDQGGLGIDFQSHLEAASQVKIYESHIRWHDWERYSSSQDRFMKLGGIIGEIYYTGDFAMLLPYLKMAENLHVGKGTSFGLGRYKMMISADH